MVAFAGMKNKKGGGSMCGMEFQGEVGEGENRKDLGGMENEVGDEEYLWMEQQWRTRRRADRRV